MTKKLTSRQKAFSHEYARTGNAERAAIEAGYSEKYARARSHEIVGKCRHLIDELNAEIASLKIADATERQEFWTALMRDEGQDMKDRLKASEILGKAQGDFIQKVEVHAPSHDDDYSRQLMSVLKKRHDGRHHQH